MIQYVVKKGSCYLTDSVSGTFGSVSPDLAIRYPTEEQGQTAAAKYAAKAVPVAKLVNSGIFTEYK